ncbi:PLP-dependent transferase [Leekyejoonella antrihumi]|uniref:homocysteine desulfhydrase n=2 Tax=Leekyejoonella antrihumi TaxID=1660198 RepID=A0A563E040_9MICO|nr:PLP-dependent transferase [Leekyejoonella antrihumi]
MPSDLSVDSQLVTLGRPPREPGAPVGPAVELTSTYLADGELSYARSGNPTWSAFEETLGCLEGGRALAFASGMAAIAASLSLTGHGGSASRPPGTVVVAPQHAYNGTGGLLAQLESDGALQVRRVDVTRTSEVVQAMDGAALVYLESPTNPMLEVADLPAVFEQARARGVLSVCDNTFSTPLLQRPIELGADVVVHSVTKYLSGHSDLLLGATIAASDDLHERLTTYRTLHGAIPGPMETWLALRGMRTLHLRLQRACASAAVLVDRLQQHPAIERVRYPGRGAIIAIEPVGGIASAKALEHAVRLWLPATSLGGVESMLERRRRHPLEPKSVPEHLVRLSVGIEDVEDLWRDLDTALRAGS